MALVGNESLARTLSYHIVESLVVTSLTQDDILQGAIEFTTLPWQVPPLIVEAPLFGVPLSDYIDRAVYVNTDALAVLWSEALANMKNRPDKVLTHAGFRAASDAIPSVKLHERPLYLSVPDGYPGGITDLAAVMLSLECAHIMRANSKLTQFVSDEDNYYAVTPFGVEVGVKAGLPTMYDDVWDTPVLGMVQEMLRVPRGALFEGCDYNIIAKVRSVAYTYQKAIKDYEAVDWALQTLRVIGGDRELLEAIYGIKRVVYEHKMRGDALAQAVVVVNQLSITDRQKIETLKHLLVPEVISSGTFTRIIYPFNKLPPPVFSQKVADRIRIAVETLHREEETMYSIRTSKPQRSV
jgi:hypothetical protein